MTVTGRDESANSGAKDAEDSIQLNKKACRKRKQASYDTTGLTAAEGPDMNLSFGSWEDFQYYFQIYQHESSQRYKSSTCIKVEARNKQIGCPGRFDQSFVWYHRSYLCREIKECPAKITAGLRVQSDGVTKVVIMSAMVGHSHMLQPSSIVKTSELNKHRNIMAFALEISKKTADVKEEDLNQLLAKWRKELDGQIQVDKSQVQPVSVVKPPSHSEEVFLYKRRRKNLANVRQAHIEKASQASQSLIPPNDGSPVPVSKPVESSVNQSEEFQSPIVACDSEPAEVEPSTPIKDIPVSKPVESSVNQSEAFQSPIVACDSEPAEVEPSTPIKDIANGDKTIESRCDEGEAHAIASNEQALQRSEADICPDNGPSTTASPAVLREEIRASLDLAQELSVDLTQLSDSDKEENSKDPLSLSQVLDKFKHEDSSPDGHYDKLLTEWKVLGTRITNRIHPKVEHRQTTGGHLPCDSKVVFSSKFLNDANAAISKFLKSNKCPEKDVVVMVKDYGTFTPQQLRDMRIYHQVMEIIENRKKIFTWIKKSKEDEKKKEKLQRIVSAKLFARLPCKVQVYRLFTLFSNEWVCSEVIEAYAQHCLPLEEAKCGFVAPAQTTTDTKGRSKWLIQAEDVVPKVKKYNKVFIPMHNEDHYGLMVVCGSARKIYVVDPMKNPSESAMATWDYAVSHIDRLLGGVGMQKVWPRKVGGQTDSVSCGIFVIVAMEKCLKPNVPNDDEFLDLKMDRRALEELRWRTFSDLALYSTH